MVVVVGNYSFYRQNLTTLEDISIIRVYFPRIESTLYTADVLMTWQEILSKFELNKTEINVGGADVVCRFQVTLADCWVFVWVFRW